MSRHDPLEGWIGHGIAPLAVAPKIVAQQQAEVHAALDRLAAGWPETPMSRDQRDLYGAALAGLPATWVEAAVDSALADRRPLRPVPEALRRRAFEQGPGAPGREPDPIADTWRGS
jgi:hypothetical protein